MVRKGIWLMALGWTVLVAGETPAWREENFPSDALGTLVDYTILLPPNYEADAGARFPVAYLLHGRGDDMRAWHPALEQVARAMRAGELPALVLVAPDAPWSRRAGYYIDSAFGGGDGLPPGAKVESVLAGELVAHVDATYRTRPDRDGRIVAGYSMGGYGALRFALARAETFGAAIVLSPAVYLPLPPADSSTREFGAFGHGRERFSAAVYQAKNYPALLPGLAVRGLPLRLFIAVGDRERSGSADPAHDLDREARACFEALRGVPGISAEFELRSGGHNWDTWQPAFAMGLRWVFTQP